MSKLVETILSNVSGPAMESLGNTVGADNDKVAGAVAAAVPLLIKALANNSSDGSGAQMLSSALDRDHDGSMLDDLAGLLGSEKSMEIGSSILSHVLGSRMGPVAEGLARTTGVDGDTAKVVIEKLAPVVMGYLGKTKKEEGLDSEGLASLLQSESKAVEEKAPGEMNLLTSLLDSDGDGDVTEEIMDIGGSLLKNFLK